MSEPIWIDADALRLLHRETLAEFGGLSGIRDEGLFLSARCEASDQAELCTETDAKRPFQCKARRWHIRAVMRSRSSAKSFCL